MSMRKAWRRVAGVAALSLAAGVLALTLPFAGATTAQQALQTPAERVSYSQGGTLYGPLMDFVHELDARSELMSVVKLTETFRGRDVVLCIVSDPPVFRPDDVVYSGKPVVLIVNNVHGGEVAGKDASMEILRDLVTGELRPLLEDVVVLVVPTINPDGAEVRRRTNEEGYDLNRDYLKLESREIRALVTQVINEWHPHIWVDTHHGGSAPYTLTYQTNMNPAGDAELVRFGNERVLARVRRALRAEEYDGFWYTGVGRVDGVEGWVPTSVEPRKQHVFATLANSVGFLFETPSNTHRVVEDGTRVVPIPEEERYRHQVRGQYIGLRELLRVASEEGEDLMNVVAEARARAIRRGNDDADDDPIPIEYRQVEKYQDDFWRRVGGGRGGRGGAAGGGQAGGRGREATYERVRGPVFTRFEPTRTEQRPWGYLLEPSVGRVVPLLLAHEITVMRLTEPLSVEVEAWHATEVRHSQYFQGHYLVELDADKRTETVELPAGAFFVPAGQPMSNFVAYILEPETDDNLVTWGYLDNVLRVTPPAGGEGAGRGGRGGTPTSGRGRGGRGGDDRTQRVPLYRLMRKTPLPAVPLGNELRR